MALPDGATEIFADVARFTVLDATGTPDSGASVFSIDALIKATLTPVIETGDDIAIKNAKGDLTARYKHGDMPKYYTVTLDISRPDTLLEAALAGGVAYSATGAALGLTTGTTAIAQTTLGTLAAGTYGYRTTQFNQYGETVAAAEVQATTTGSTGTVVIGTVTMAAGALGWRVYGRAIGQEQLLGQVNAFSGATSAASGTGAVSSLAVTGLSVPIPAGSTFQIAGDTNSPKIVFTTTAEVGIGAVSVPVTASQSVTTTIAAGALQPVFVDNGSLVPLGAVPTVDTTAGPGANVGYQAPLLGIVGNPNGVALELFGKAVVNGQQATYLPYWRWLVPGVRNLHQMPRDFTNALLQNTYEGQAFENPNFGSGPFGDWPFDSTKVFQRMRCSSLIVPTPALAPGVASY